MFSSLSANLSTLVRQEIQLAKAEATAEAKKAGTGAGMMAGAALAAVLVLLFLSMALMWALGSVMHLGWAALIVAVIWAIVAAVLALLGKKHFDRIKGLPQTQETVQEIPPTLNPSKETP
ncbi:phage holin family protein [Citricoccus sp. I39-566]|uniref:phage holin family protein n=1 Tax=Citricoccus sp. I39-566 TaxID=3073268 RepID=UPI00286C63EB|nr:phage holin family protein [Citricoccus sp. I39-566]WMY79777.1 phage holin family protein [Citricoccus sp. I39-566]